MPSLARLPPPVLRIENYENYVDPARVVMGALTEGLDDTPATLTLSFPADPAAPLSLLQNARVIVTVDDRYVFVGHIRLVRRSGSGLDRSVTAVAYDARHAMSGRIVGQYGIGEIPTKGGWYGVGYDCEFNPDGKPNKTPYPCLAAPSRGIRFENVYRFARPGHHEADWWYNIDVLLWLLNWYAADDVVEIDTDALNSIATLASLCTVRDVNATPLPRALTTVLRSCGLRWTIRYDNRACNVIGESEPVGVFTVLGATVTAPASHAIYIPSLSAPRPTVQRPRDEHLCDDWEVEDNTLEVADRTEAHADGCLYETTWAAYPPTNVRPEGETALPLLVQATTSDDKQYAYMYLQNLDGLCDDATLYAGGAAGVPYDGASYPPGDPLYNYALWEAANTIPVKWLKTLLPVSASGRACSWVIDPDAGNEGRAIDNLFVKSVADGVTEWTRVKSGAKIDYDEGKVYLKGTLGLDSPLGADGTESVSFASAPLVKFTVCSVLPLHRVSASDESAIVMPQPMVRMLHIRRLYRVLALNAEQVTSASADTNTAVVLHSGATATTVRDVDTELAQRLADLLAAEALGSVRRSGTFSLPQITSYEGMPHIGDEVTFSSYNPGMPDSGSRVVAVVFDLQTLAHRITAVDAFL